MPTVQPPAAALAGALAAALAGALAAALAAALGAAVPAGVVQAPSTNTNVERIAADRRMDIA
jgi:hypothetical protein